MWKLLFLLPFFLLFTSSTMGENQQSRFDQIRKLQHQNAFKNIENYWRLDSNIDSVTLNNTFLNIVETVFLL